MSYRTAPLVMTYAPVRAPLPIVTVPAPCPLPPASSPLQSYTVLPTPTRPCTLHSQCHPRYFAEKPSSLLDAVVLVFFCRRANARPQAAPREVREEHDHRERGDNVHVSGTLEPHNTLRSRDADRPEEQRAREREEQGRAPMVVLGGGFQEGELRPS